MGIIKLSILIVAFSIILSLLIFIYIYKPAKARARVRTEKRATKKEKREVPTFAKLVQKIKMRDTTSEELEKAVRLLLKYYGTIPSKNGIAPSREFKKYAEVIYFVARHPNTTKEIVLFFDKEINAKNPQYHREIDEMLSRGLTARG